MAEGLSDEEREQALYAARSGIVELMANDPALAIRLGADDLTKVYLAGVVAGVDAASRVFEIVARDLGAES